MPAHGDIQVDGLLTKLSIRLADQTPNLIGRRVAPVVPMDVQSGPYPFFGREEFKVTGADDDLVGMLGEPNVFEPSMTHDTYSCLGHAEMCMLAVEQQRRAQPQFEVAIEPELAAIVRRQLMRHEIKVATLLQTPANFHASNQIDIDNLANRRWDEANQTALVDIDTAIDRVELCIGMPPTDMIMPRAIWNVFKNLSAVSLAIKGYTGGAITPAEVAAHFGLERLHIAGGVYDAALKGQAESRTRIWSGKHTTLLYVTPNPAPKTPNTAYTFVWNPPEGGEMGRVVTRWFIPELGTMGADAAKAAWWNDVKATGVDSPSLGKIISGYLIKNLIA